MPAYWAVTISGIPAVVVLVSPSPWFGHRMLKSSTNTQRSEMMAFNDSSALTITRRKIQPCKRRVVVWRRIPGLSSSSPGAPVDSLRALPAFDRVLGSDRGWDAARGLAELLSFLAIPIRYYFSTKKGDTISAKRKCSVKAEPKVNIRLTLAKQKGLDQTTSSRLYT